MKTAIILFTALALMAFGVMGLARPANAESQCADHAAVVAGLARNYGETVRAMGLSSATTMIEMFASDAGTWTIVETDASGNACLRASGGAFEIVAKVVPIPGEAG